MLQRIDTSQPECIRLEMVNVIVCSRQVDWPNCDYE